MTNKVNFPAEFGGDGRDYTDDADPNTGLANGGFRPRLLPMLANVISALQWIAATCQTVLAYRNDAQSSSNAAAGSADDAATHASNAGDSASNAGASSVTASKWA